jgi:hypothetical protein
MWSCRLDLSNGLIALGRTNQGARNSAKERPWRHTGKLNDLSGHVRLVGVARRERHVTEQSSRSGFCYSEKLLEANNSLEGLGAVTNGRLESAMQLPLADADLPGQLRDALGPAGRQPRDRVPHDRVRPFDRVRSRDDQ